MTTKNWCGSFECLLHSRVRGTNHHTRINLRANGAWCLETGFSLQKTLPILCEREKFSGNTAVRRATFDDEVYDITVCVWLQVCSVFFVQSMNSERSPHFELFWSRPWHICVKKSIFHQSLFLQWLKKKQELGDSCWQRSILRAWNFAAPLADCSRMLQSAALYRASKVLQYLCAIFD